MRVCQKAIRPNGENQAGGFSGKLLALFLLAGGRGSLGGLGLGHTLLEFVHASGGINEFLLASVKRVARVANTDDNHWLSGLGLDDVAARATDLCIHILRMYVLFHKRPHTIAFSRKMTRPIIKKPGMRVDSN
jgi:hypothetical protein